MDRASEQATADMAARDAPQAGGLAMRPKAGERHLLELERRQRETWGFRRLPPTAEAGSLIKCVNRCRKDRRLWSPQLNFVAS